MINENEGVDRPRQTSVGRDPALRIELTVPAKTMWTSTGIRGTTDDEFLIVAPGGRVHACVSGGCDEQVFNAWIGPQGFVNEHRLPDVLMPEAPLMSLIGRIGDRNIFYVGQVLRLKADHPGVLWLGINDKVFDDNGGEFKVTLSNGQ